MLIKQQCALYEQAKKIYILGVRYERGNYWFPTYSHDEVVYMPVVYMPAIEAASPAPIPTYTVAELGIMLPEFVEKGDKQFRLIRWKNMPENSESGKMVHRICYEQEFTEGPERIPGWEHPIVRDWEAVAMADLLILILEEKMVTVETINDSINNA